VPRPGSPVSRARRHTSFEKNQVESVTRRVKGVTRVTNNLTYEYEWVWQPDWRIQEAIESQLLWSPYVDENNIEVAVDRGVATLTGVVSNWSEWSAAEKNAYQGGAKDVRNRLGVTFRNFGPDYPDWDWMLYPIDTPALGGVAAKASANRQ
jgi:hypothetical protein